MSLHLAEVGPNHRERVPVGGLEVPLGPNGLGGRVPGRQQIGGQPPWAPGRWPGLDQLGRVASEPVPYRRPQLAGPVGHGPAHDVGGAAGLGTGGVEGHGRGPQPDSPPSAGSPDSDPAPELVAYAAENRFTEERLGPEACNAEMRGRSVQFTINVTGQPETDELRIIGIVRLEYPDDPDRPGSDDDFLVRTSLHELR